MSTDQITTSPDEPITAEWLRSIGFEPSAMGFTRRGVLFADVTTKHLYLYLGSMQWSMILDHINTRSKLLRLISALNGDDPQ